jgi:DNA-binding transcriptional LysR family regulator
MEDVRGFEARLTTVRETLPDALDIGLIDNMAANPDCHLIEALADLRRQRPDLDLRVGVHPVTSIDVLVRERRIDVGFTGKPDFLTPLTYVHAFDERHALFVSRTCPQYEAIVRWTKDAKTPIPYVVRTFPSKHFQKFEETMPFEVTAIGNSLEAILTAVCAGFGAGILPVHAARQFSDLERLPFPEGGLSVPFYIVFRKDAERHPAVTAFLKTFRKHAPDTRAAAQV